jgi:tRNA1Val (adenine37-N6)-methyltransferase
MKSSNHPEERTTPHETVDELLEGRLKLIQSREGYRFSVDALFLAEFVTVKPGDFLVDLGTGCGVIPLLLLATKPLKHALGIEIQADLALQAWKNAAANDRSREMDILLGDIRHPPFVSGTADVVTCNPPYRKPDSGRINPNTSRAIARHEIFVSLEHILAAACHVLKKKGRFAMVYSAERLIDVMNQSRRFNLEPKRLQVVYPDLHSSAKIVLIEAVLDGNPGVKILPPILGQGKYSISSPA